MTGLTPTTQCRSGVDPSWDQSASPAYLFSVEVAQGLIQQAFAVSLNLAGCTKLVAGPAADRLREAIADLDRLIVDLRQATGRYPDSGAETV